MVVLGIDPGLANTGWGVVEERRGMCRCRAYGCIHTTTEADLAARLRHIVDELVSVVDRYQPHAAAVEGIYFGANVRSAIPTAHARGAALVACSLAGVEVGEYTPMQIKQAVVGTGAADKRQVTYMVRSLLNLDHDPKPDHAADALACAICHANLWRTAAATDGAYVKGEGKPLRMIAQLHGILLEATLSVAVLDVSGIGFEVGISGMTAASLPPLGEEVRLYTRMRIGNDAVALFGFATVEERTMFDRLVAVSSVGPRLALAVLSKYSVSQIYSIVMAEDITGMSAVPGVGKKTAQRLILELKGTLAKDHGLAAADVPAAGQLPLSRAASSPLDDARAALLSMGFSPQETDLALDGYDEGMRVEDLLAAALKRLRDGCMMWEADEQDLWQDVPQRQGAANGPAAARGDRFVTGNLTSDDLDVERSLRPQLLDDYCGQEHIKQSLRILIEAAQSRGETLDHVIFSGPPGLGKTTLASVLANELGAQIKTTSGPAIERTGDLAAILTNLQPGDVLFIDEIHRLNRSVEEILYPAMEDFALDIVIGKGPAARSIRLEIPRFTLVGATTRSGMLTGPLRDRFGISFRLDYYAIEDLAQIVERSASILGVQIDHDSAVEIGSRSRGTPRLANRLLKRVRDYAQVRGSGAIDLKTAREALEFFEIDELGLDWMDIRILETLAQTFRGRAVGLSTLASAVGEDSSTLEDVYEPYLLQRGLIVRTPQGRMATTAAFDHLGMKPPTA